jgi:hypothetical protein
VREDHPSFSVELPSPGDNEGDDMDEQRSREYDDANATQRGDGLEQRTTVHLSDVSDAARRGPGAAAATGRADGARRATAARWVTALAVLVSAVVHLILWNDGMRSVDVVGPAFLVNGVGGIVLAVLVVTWRHWLPLLGAAGFGAATLGAYTMSRTVGLFGVNETIWTSEAVISAVVEVIAIVFALVALAAERRRA